MARSKDEDRELLKALETKRLLQCKKNPVAFAHEWLGIEPWDRQAEILRAAAEHTRVAVRSGHKIGKSTSAAILALWWYSTRERGRVIMSSSSYRQVKDILWAELRRLKRTAKRAIDGHMHELPEAGLQADDGRQILGFATDHPERMAGYSGPEMLFILDEASGIESVIFEAVEGNIAGGGKIVMFSNPTKTDGVFYDAFSRARSSWHCIHVSSEETPNVKTGKLIVPGLATRAWVEEQKANHGENSAFYAVRIRVNFPTQSENTFISFQIVEEALARWEKMPEPKAAKLHVGVDVARFGSDESVIWARRGQKAFLPRAFHGLDVVNVAGQARTYIHTLLVDGEKPVVKVDVIGIGAGVADILRANEPSWEIIDVNVSEKAPLEDKFLRLRDQMWGAVLRNWLKEGGAIPNDDKLVGELLAPTYGFDAQGRMKIESKDEMKKRIGRSTDRADALALALYEAPSEFVCATSDNGWMEY